MTHPTDDEIAKFLPIAKLTNKPQIWLTQQDAIAAIKRALLAEQARPMGTNLAQECAKARRHGFLDALSSGTARELCVLLRRGVYQLEAWHAKYGEHQPQWLPPAGEVQWMEDVAATLDGRATLRAKVERLAAQGAPTGSFLSASEQQHILSNPHALKILMDYHDHQQDQAESMLEPEDVTHGNERRAQELKEKGRSIMATDLEIWSAELLRRFGFSTQPSQAPVVQAVQARELVEQEMAMLIRRLCSTTANDKTRTQAMEYLLKRGHASPLRAKSEAAQAMQHPPLPEGVKARFKCEDCGGTGYTGEMIPGSEFQPPEPVGCTSCNFTGWWAECDAYSADQMHAYLDADRASSGATTQAVRMLTEREIYEALAPSINDVPRSSMFDAHKAIQRKFCEVNAGRTIPPSGEIGGV